MSDGPLMLAIESSGGRVGCAIGAGAQLVAAAVTDRGRRHAESLAPQIEAVLEQAGVGPKDLDAIAVDVGPGLYTGLRVGVMTARTMATLLGVPVVPVCSLEIVAHGARWLDDQLLVAVDARRGEVFHALADCSPAGAVLRAEPEVAAPDELLTALGPGGDRIVVGDGGPAHAERFVASGWRLAPAELSLPDPAAMLRLAAPRVGEAVDPAQVQPRYLRRPDAVAKWEPAS